MAYVNVAEWKPEQVTEWLKGLDNAVLVYIHSFLNNEVNGQQLLNLRPDDLNHLGVHKLGHQELILEAVEHLRNFNYELDRENLQLLALRLSCKAHSLHNELRHCSDSPPLATQTLADVASIITAVKPFVCWLDRSPFSGQFDYQEYKAKLLRLSLQIATCAQRDRFAERPVEEIRSSCKELANLADSIIQDIVDPLILQPASLDLATLKKRAGDDLGFFILPSFHGVHQISEIKFSSPAHQCGKIEDGDEVVQVNYQTVVGWQTKKVMALFEESPTDMFLTLKKRPRHTKVYGQIYMKPYRLPSKKRASPYSRWHDNLPSPRPELLTIPDFQIPLPRSVGKIVTLKPAHINIEPLPSTLSSEEDEDDDDDDTFLPSTIEEGHASPTSMRLYLPKPRSTVQRRATVTGASPTGKRPPVNIEQFWEDLRTERHLGDGLDGRKEKNYLLRDKSASFGNDLSESSFPRPKTCLGIDKTSTRLKSLKKQKLLRVNDNDNRKIKNGVCSSEDQTQDKENVNLNNTTNKIDFEKSNEDKEYELSFNELTYHRLRNKEFEPLSPLDDYSHKASIEVVLDGPISELCSTSSIKNEGHLFANEALLNLSTAEHNEKKECISSDSSKILNNSLFGSDAAEITQIFSSYTEKAKPILLKERGRLDKSYSTPAYDLTDHDDLILKIKNINCLKEHVHLNVCDVEDQISASYIPQGNTIYCHTPLQNTERDEISQLIPSSKKLLNVEQKINMNNGQIAEEEIDIDVKQTQRITEILETINTALVQHRLKEQAHIKQRDSHKHQENPILSTDAATAVSHCLHTVEVINNLDSENNKIVLDIIEHEKQNTHILTSPFVHQELNDSFDNFEESPVFTNKLIATDLENSNNFISTGGFEKLNMNLTNSIEHSQKSLNISPPVKICITPPEPPPRSLPLLEPIKSNSTVTLAGIGQKAKSLYRSNGGKSSSAASLPSPRSLRERTTLLAKKRNIAVCDLSNVDCEGWLLHRCRSSGTGAVWLKVWFILIGSIFYGFKTPHSPKADIMIGLSGFTASLAEEVKSRKFAFKIYHTGTVFYFAAETDDELTMWLDCIVLATLKQDFNKPSVGMDSDCVFFSETDDDSDSEKEIEMETRFSSPKMRKLTAGFLGSVNPHQQDKFTSKSIQNLSEDMKGHYNQKKLGSLRKIAGKSDNGVTTSSQEIPVEAASSLDRKYLRFLGGSRNNIVPVPTPQFRSYRRVPTTPVKTSHDKITSRLCKHENIDENKIKSSIQAKPFNETECQNNKLIQINTSLSTAHVSPIKKGIINNNTGLTKDNTSNSGSISNVTDGQILHGTNVVECKTKVIEKPLPLSRNLKVADRLDRQIHASNPSLQFPSDILDYRLAAERLREFGISRNRQREDTSGFVTLEEFMLSRQEEERRQQKCYLHSRSVSSSSSSGSSTVPSVSSSSSTFTPCDNHHAGQSYEFIEKYEENWLDANNKQMARRGSSNSLSLENQNQKLREGSPEKFWINYLCQNEDIKRKPNGFKKNSSTSKLNSNNPSNCGLKNAAQYKPPPVSQGVGSGSKIHPKEPTKMKMAFEMHLGDTTLEKEVSSSKSSKFRDLFFSSKSPKPSLEQPIFPPTHKTLLGSPRLHRALFRDKRTQGSKGNSTDSASPVSPPSDCSQKIYATHTDSNMTAFKPTMGISMIGKKPMRRVVPPHPVPSPCLNSPPPPDYPGLEYPPVFEPETYTLSDASTLLRSRPTHSNSAAKLHGAHLRSRTKN